MTLSLKWPKLQAAISMYQLQHTKMKATQALGQAAGLKIGLMRKALEGTAHIGAEAWLKIETEIGITLYQQYVALKAGKK